MSVQWYMGACLRTQALEADYGRVRDNSRHIMQLNHVALQCDGLETSVQFYHEGLGLAPMP